VSPNIIFLNHRTRIFSCHRAFEWWS